MANPKKLSWKTEKRKPIDLVESGFNPSIATEEKQKALADSLDEFNLVDIPVINKDNTIISGHKRIKQLIIAGRGEEKIDVRVPNRQLEEIELKKYMLIANTHAGLVDAKLLEVNFSDIKIDFEIPFFVEEKDYSGKNREVDVSNFKNEMKMGLTFTNENYLRIKDELNKRTITAEAAMLSLIHI
jgi:hypothetical protein